MVEPETSRAQRIMAAHLNDWARNINVWTSTTNDTQWVIEADNNGYSLCEVKKEKEWDDEENVS